MSTGVLLDESMDDGGFLEQNNDKREIDTSEFSNDGNDITSLKNNSQSILARNTSNMVVENLLDNGSEDAGRGNKSNDDDRPSTISYPHLWEGVEKDTEDKANFSGFVKYTAESKESTSRVLEPTLDPNLYDVVTYFSTTLRTTRNWNQETKKSAASTRKTSTTTTTRKFER
jgi:hypothetical protein